jgi:prepilin-type N-terminal cleavage/methylation domain-containing protein
MIKKYRDGFSMIELIFVIIIIAIISKFGFEFLFQAYDSFISTKINNELQARASYTVEFIAKKLESRIKQSVIYRDLSLGTSDTNFRFLSSNSSQDATVLEWIATDIHSFRVADNIGDYWSGVIDLNSSLSNSSKLKSIRTNTTNIDKVIQALSNKKSTKNDMAIYFIQTDEANNEWGWDGDKIKFDNQSAVNIHPINCSSNVDEFIPAPKSDSTPNSFTGVQAKEFYTLSWSAYAISLEDFNETTKTGDLYLYQNYQPWQGEQYDDTGIGIDKNLIMQNISTFRFRAAGSLIKIQICIKSDLIKDQEYSICKEKTIY